MGCKARAASTCDRTSDPRRNASTHVANQTLQPHPRLRVRVFMCMCMCACARAREDGGGGGGGGGRPGPRVVLC